MPENLKEVDAELRALRDKKRAMLEHRKQTSTRRKGLVSSRALARQKLREARTALRKQISKMDAILTEDEKFVIVELETMQEHTKAIAEWTMHFVQSRDALEDLDSAPIAEGDEESEDFE